MSTMCSTGFTSKYMRSTAIVELKVMLYGRETLNDLGFGENI